MGRSAWDGDEQRDYSKKKEHLVEARIVALEGSKVLAQGVGQKRCSVNVRCPVQPHRGCGVGVAVCLSWVLLVNRILVKTFREPLTQNRALCLSRHESGHAG